MQKEVKPDNQQAQYVFDAHSPLYVLDLDLLEAGDIILTREKSNTSIAVRALTFGSYSHAIICLSNQSAIDATIEGKVFSLNPQRLIFKNATDCTVLRTKLPLSDNEKKTMEMHLRLLVATPYSIKEAVKTSIEKYGDSSGKENTQFCSRLVAQTYQKINIELVKNPDFCSPNAIHKSNLLRPIPTALRVATASDIDIINKPDLVAENRKQTYAWLDPVIILAKTVKFNIATLNDVDEFLLKYPQYDQEVCGYIEKTRYLTQYQDDITANPSRYTYDPKDLLNIENELQQIYSLLTRYEINYRAACHNYAQYSTQYNQLTKNLYSDLLKHQLKRLKTLATYDDLSASEPKKYSEIINQLSVSITQILK